jgi:hypothetical protein
MRQSRRPQSQGNASEGRELVSLSVWLLACALLLEEDGQHAISEDHCTRHEEDTTRDSAVAPRAR